MKKRIISIISVFVLMIACIFSVLNAFASEINWTYDVDKQTLTVYGRGDMENYSVPNDAPWAEYLKSIKFVQLEEGITSIGAYAFSGAENLQNVTLPSTLTALNENAFSACPKLTKLYLSETVNSIYDESFAYNGTSLKDDFILQTDPASYSLYFAVKNHIPFSCSSIKCTQYTAKITTGGMRAYFPYTPLYNGTYKFYSSGMHDTIGYLYNSNFEQLKFNDDSSSSNTNFLITADLEKGKTYYIGVNIYNFS